MADRLHRPAREVRMVRWAWLGVVLGSGCPAPPETTGLAGLSASVARRAACDVGDPPVCTLLATASPGGAPGGRRAGVLLRCVSPIAADPLQSPLAAAFAGRIVGGQAAVLAEDGRGIELYRDAAAAAAVTACLDGGACRSVAPRGSVVALRAAEVGTAELDGRRWWVAAVPELAGCDSLAVFPDRPLTAPAER